MKANLKAHGRIRGMGHYFPDEKEKKPGEGGQRVETVVDMGMEAGKMALEDAGMVAGDVDVLICTSSTTFATFNPSTLSNKYMDISLPLQTKIGLWNAFVFDVGSCGNLGFINSSLTAVSLLKSLHKKNAMVVCAENPEPISRRENGTSLPMRPGGAAIIWESAEDSVHGIIDASVYTDGSGFNDVNFDEENKLQFNRRNKQDGIIEKLQGVSKEILERNNTSMSDIDWVIPFQGSPSLLGHLQTALQVPEKKILSSIEERGDMLCVSSPGCLSEHYHKKKIRRGELIFNCDFGKGSNWGGMLFTL